MTDTPLSSRASGSRLAGGLSQDRLTIGPAFFALGLVACFSWVMAFGLTHVDTLPPHEDEALTLFVGRQSVTSLLSTVLEHRGGAPLHFLVGWCVVHLGGDLFWLRFMSMCFAAAAVPVVGCLAARLTDRAVGFATSVLVSSSWVFLFNAVFGRMYSLFLLTSAVSCLALCRTRASGSNRWFMIWGVTALAAVASHPYGALLLVAQGLFILSRPGHRWKASMTLAVAALLAIPLWKADLVLRSRYAVGVGRGGGRLGSLGSIGDYLHLTVSDFSTGERPAYWGVVLLAAFGFGVLVRHNRPAALIAGIIFAVPVAFLFLLHLNSSTSPQSRHLIFVLPFFSLCVAQGLLCLLRAVPRLPLIAAVGLLGGASFLYVSWGHHRTPPLFQRESSFRIDGRAAASAWLASDRSSDDVLMGYEPIFLQAWQRRHQFSGLVVPRADPRLARDALVAFPKPLGRGVWVFDAKNVPLGARARYRELPYPDLARRFVMRRFGPYLVLRTRLPVMTVENYIRASVTVTKAERRFGIVNADIELNTIEVAKRLLTSRLESDLAR